MSSDQRSSNWRPDEEGALDKLKHHSPGAERYISHPSQARIGMKPFPSKLYVLTMVENPLQWNSRSLNYWRFQKHMEDSNVELYTAEVQLGGRPFEITEANNPKHLQLRSYGEFWRKENVLNLLAQRLPPECQYICTFDADIQLVRTDWAQQVMQLLQHYDVIQPFSHSRDLDANSSPIHDQHSHSFMYQWIENGVMPHDEEFVDSQTIKWTPKGVVKPNRSGVPRGSPYTSDGPAVGWHPGLAWCYRKSAWDIMGGLMDWLPTGSGDWHMANAFIGHLMSSIDERHTDSYKRHCKIWQDRVCPTIRDNPNGGLGYMPGLILHHYHGKRVNRQYEVRHKFVLNVNYDPDLDIIKDHQGLWQLTDRNVKLRDGLRLYARARNEDQ